MIEIVLTQYEKHQPHDIVLKTCQCKNETEAARWLRDSWDNECDDIFGKNPIKIRKLAKQIKETGDVMIETPYCADTKITWTIVRH